MNLIITFCSILFVVFGEIESQSVLPFFELSEDASVITGIVDYATIFNFSTPFHFNDRSYYNAYISTHGLVSFGQGFTQYESRILPLSDTRIIAPYWEDIDLNVKGNIFFESYNYMDNEYPLKNISDFITNSQALSQKYDPLSATIIHWSNVCNYQDKNCSNSSPSSFQVVLTSNENFSYVIFTYKCGSLNWNLYYAGIGYSAGTEFYKNHILSMKPNVNDIACLNEPHSEWSNVVYRVDGDRPTECVTDSVRLVGGSNPSEGQVELCVSQFWHPVCDNGFTVNETGLICGALGYDFSEEMISIKDADPRDNNNELYEVICNTQETSLEGCSIIPCEDSTDIGQPFIYCLAATSPVCETDCNPTRRHPECCSDENSGKFLEVENNSFVIRYIVCPVTKPDYCDMI